MLDWCSIGGAKQWFDSILQLTVLQFANKFYLQILGYLLRILLANDRIMKTNNANAS